MSRAVIITLLTDFGTKDAYVGCMKGVILGICPHARVVDIGHEIEKFNVRMEAFILASAAPYFPEGTIHVAVVDPGVGTGRRPILVEAKRGFYIGPDNGLLMLAAQEEGIGHAYQISNPRYMLPRVSRTFHGRDIFSASAAHLAKGRLPATFGPEIRDYVLPTFAEPVLERNTVLGEVLHIDDFGNIITNISAKELEELGVEDGDKLNVQIHSGVLTLKLCSAYGEIPAGTPLTIIGSADFLEISINQGNASQALKAKAGTPVRISPAK